MRTSLLALGIAWTALGCGGEEAASTDTGPALDAAPETRADDEAIAPDSAADGVETMPDATGGDGDAAEVEEDTTPLEIEDSSDSASEETATPDAGEVPDTSPWRSALYPETWTPGSADSSGAMLQDYSYAGYHHGEVSLGAGLGGTDALARFSVSDFGALAAPGDDAALAGDSTAAFQAAIDAAAAGGGRVHVPAGLYRIDGRLVVGASRVVIAGDGAESRLWFTRREGMDYAAHLTFAGGETVTAEADLESDASALDGAVEVADASAFAPGDDVLVGQLISDAFVAEHGMSGVWQAFNGTWQAFYRRTVVAVDPSAVPPRVVLDVPLRSRLRVSDGASLRRVQGTLHEVGLQDLAIANATDWEGAWAGDQVNAVTFEHVADAWALRVVSFPSPGAPASGMGAGAHLQSNGLLVSGSKRVTIAECRLEKAQNRGSGGNGYLFEVRQSSEVLTRDSTALSGRHNFIQNWGFGTTGCVWLRVFASDGAQVPLGPLFDTTIAAPSEFHHSLATANLIDTSRFEDGFHAVNRGSQSTGAGHTATECVFWNVGGSEIVSLQYGLGYVIGTAPETTVSTSLALPDADGSAPEDWVEGRGNGASLEPGSLYEDQLARRTQRSPQ